MIQIFKTYQPRGKNISRKWHLVNARGQVLGRLATRIAGLLMGKHKVDYVPHLDSGDYVVVINSKDVVVTGQKESKKTYFRHSGYPGGLKSETFLSLQKKSPGKVIELAVKRMLPTNRLKDNRMRRLKIVVGDEHPYGDRVKEQENIS